MRALRTVTAVGAVLASSSIASAQALWDQRMPRDGACFYLDADYSGRSFCVDMGDDLETLPGGADNRVSSIRILGRAEVTVFKDTRFRGDSRRFTTNVRDLEHEDFNDRISSVEIRRAGYGNGPSYGSQNPDRIVRRAYQDILEREPDEAGLRLYRSRLLDDNWTEKQVRDALRNSPEYRQKTTMTRAKAEAIVRNAYLAVLNREPDAGSRGYVDKVFRDKWTQQDVERELRKSAEYRNR